jgi:dolichyldiphosphatase
MVCNTRRSDIRRPLPYDMKTSDSRLPLPHVNTNPSTSALVAGLLEQRQSIYVTYILQVLQSLQTSLIVTALSAFFLLYTRSAGVAYFCAGGVMCSWSVKLVKLAVRQPRPPAHPSQKKTTYGYEVSLHFLLPDMPMSSFLSMPSTHSATITYYAIYVPLACAYLPLHKSLPNETTSRILPLFVVIPWACLISVSRVWLGHHTWPQVIAGCSCGVAFAAFWFALWTNGFNEHGRVLERQLESYI